MEPPFYYVRDSASPVAHHWDYLRDRRATALCGQQYLDEIRWEGTERPAKVCRRCQDVLPRFEAVWWRKAARRAQAHRERLEATTKHLERELASLKRQVTQLTYQLELSKDSIEASKARIDAQRTKIESQAATIKSHIQKIEKQAQKIENQRKTLHNLQSARAVAKTKSIASTARNAVRSPQNSSVTEQSGANRGSPS